MYYVNENQIRLRLDQIPLLIRACEELQAAWNDGAGETLLLHLAQERTLQLAIETVTDIGSLLIDAFMMRDASSYEDIVDILQGEGVFGPEAGDALRRIVALRRPLVQDYALLERSGPHPLIGELPVLLSSFAEAVPAFIRKESLS